MGKLQEIPGVGKNIEQDLINIGIREISDLKGKKPEELYCRIVYTKDFRKISASFMFSALPCILPNMKPMKQKN